jgi:uncharacterized protein YkwD
MSARIVVVFLAVSISMSLSFAGASKSDAAASSTPPANEFADREPTHEETLILELINRFRADPKAEALRILPAGEGDKPYSGKGVDWKMFKDEMDALHPAPPVFFNLDLLEASRRHARYMILNELTHVEDPAKAGFYGVGFGERCTKAGYKGFAGGENAFRDPSSPLGSHKGFVVDNGEGPGGMQPGRGHRSNMINPGFREVGCSAVPHGGHISVVHDLGSRKPRLVGGVVYFDRNHDYAYDMGEGVGGVKIACSDGGSTTTWKSGAYVLDLKGEGQVTVTAEYLGQSHTETIPAGKNNFKFDWIIPEKAALERADQLIATVEAIKDRKASSYTNAVLSLYIGSRDLALDETRMKKIADLAGEWGVKLETRQSAVLEALRAPQIDTFGKILEDNRKPFKGTVADSWFTQAELVASAKLTAAAIAKQAEDPAKAAFQGQYKKELAGQIKGMEAQITYSNLKSELSAVLTGLGVPEKTTTATKRQKT